ncbi:MAG: pilus assembly protein TadG-related protein [Mesorhizobium sp.]
MRSYRKFLRSDEGSFAPAFALSLMPLLLALGIAVDYTSATTDRAQMQNALDSAIISITTMDRNATDAQRETILQSVYAGNGGRGTARLRSVSFDADGTMHASTSASYAMPTNFMNLANINNVTIDVDTSVRKNPALVKAEFNVDRVSGYWGKTMTLYGTPIGSSNASPLMKIEYAYKEFKFTYSVGTGNKKKDYSVNDPKGYGTSTTYIYNGTTATKVGQQICTTTASFNAPKATAGVYISSGFDKNDPNKPMVYFSTTCPATTGASVDVSSMNDLYLQMDVPSANPSKLKSNDPNTSDRLYIGVPSINNGQMIEVAKGKTVDIFTAVPCEQTSNQAWEDGGNPVPADVSNADFFYSVTGKCDFNKRPSVTSLVQ